MVQTILLRVFFYPAYALRCIWIILMLLDDHFSATLLADDFAANLFMQVIC